MTGFMLYQKLNGKWRDDKMSDKYQNTELIPEERAAYLLEELSLDEKVAQLNCVFPFDKASYDFAGINEQTKHGIGQVSTLEMRRMESLDEVVRWQRKVQRIVMENSPHRIPAIFHMEGLCGAFIQDSTSFPSGIGRGAGWNPKLEEKIAEIVSRQEAACGITHVFAPVLDISRDSRMGRQGETYGEDPVLTASLGSAYTKGCQKYETAGRRTESVAKHFLAFHNSAAGIHGANSDTPERLLEEIYGKPFQAAITEAGLRGIMPCYCLINGEPASASHHLLTELLREEMGFDGLCVSDYGAINNAFMFQGIGETKEETGLLCLEAGMDMELPSVEGYGEAFKNLFASGRADMDILDRAVKRVLTAKFRMGLFEHPFALEGEELRRVFMNKKDKEISLQSAKESMVLIKNNGVLPIQKSVKKIALIGPHADSPRKFFGGYTHMCMMESTYAIANSIAGVSGSENVDNKEIVTVPGTNIQSDETPEFDVILKRQKPDCRSILEELKAQMPDAEIRYAYGYPIAGADQSGYARALEIAEDADIVILAVKPWLIDQILSVIRLEPRQVLVSIAGGVTFEQLVNSVGPEQTIFRLIPNTAISERQSMTLIASRNASKEQEQLMLDIFNELGMAMLIPESQMGATTALTSCGIAYVLKYIQAAMQAGIEMGVCPKDAQKMVAQSVKGAAELILNNDTHPSVEIDKVTTPGGITIKGINELDHAGFTSAVIKAIKAGNVE